MLDRWPVPMTWEWTSAGDIAQIVGGGTPSTKDPENFSAARGIPWIGPADLTGYNKVYIGHGRRYLSAKGYESSGATLMPAGAVLFSSRAPIGYCAIADQPVSTNQGFKSWVCAAGILPEYVRYYLLNSVEYADSLASGTTFREISGKRVEGMRFPLPPLAEQRRIVAKLDTLTARIARARAELGRVPMLTGLLRRFVLSRAFAGELTMDWRAAHGLADFRWRSSALGEIADVQGGIQVGKKRPANVALIDTPYLRVANVQRGWLKLDEVKTLAVTVEEKARLLLRDGDILMNEGGDRDKLGRGWVWRGEVPGCIHQNHVFRIRLKDRAFPPEFVSHYTNEFGQTYFIDQGTQTTNLASISKSRVMALPVPIPTAAEAVEIVRLISAAFTRADRLEAEASRALKMLDRLEASILAKAFRGELVPQDPADEPASILLDRIRAEHAVEPKLKRGRRGRARVNA